MGIEPLLLRLRMAMLERVQHVVLEQFLVADAHLDRMTGWTVLLVPALDQRHVQRTAGATCWITNNYLCLFVNRIYKLQKTTQ